MYILICSNVYDDNKIFEICGFMKNINQNIFTTKQFFPKKNSLIAI